MQVLKDPNEVIKALGAKKAVILFTHPRCAVCTPQKIILNQVMRFKPDYEYYIYDISKLGTYYSDMFNIKGLPSILIIEDGKVKKILRGLHYHDEILRVLE